MLTKLLEKIESFFNGEYKDIPSELMSLVRSKILIVAICAVILFVCAFFFPIPLLAVLLVVTVIVCADSILFCNDILEKKYVNIKHGEIVSAEKRNPIMSFRNRIHGGKDVWISDKDTGETYHAVSSRDNMKFTVGMGISGYLTIDYQDQEGVNIVKRFLKVTVNNSALKDGA